MKSPEQPILHRTDIPPVALESMNITHQEEVELINQLGSLLAQDERDEPAITHKLEEWLEHTRAHFERENLLMQEHGFPAYPIHSGEHREVLEHMEALYRQWLEDKTVEPLAAYLLEEWPRWFDAHVRSMDTATAMFISQRTG